jgi:hypothetical protein
MRANSLGVAGVFAVWISGAAEAQAPVLTPPPNPDVTTVECHDEPNPYGLAGKLCLYKCMSKSQSLTCSFLYTREADGPYAYIINDAELKGIILVDNFREDHSLLRKYYLDGRGKRQQKVILDKGDYVWLVEEFGDGANDIKSARIVFSKPPLQGGQLWFSLGGPVESAQ